MTDDPLPPDLEAAIHDHADAYDGYRALTTRDFAVREERYQCWQGSLRALRTEILAYGQRCRAEERERARGDGTPFARWVWLLDALERRFPTPPVKAIRSDVAPEERYLAQIDAAIRARGGSA